MTILTVNAGSSSIRLDAFAREAGGWRRVASHHGDADLAQAEAVLRGFLDRIRPGDIAAVAHRVVHGGDRLRGSCLIDADVEREVERLSALAPLHNPASMAWLRACRALLGAGVPQVAVFDTAFYADLPEVAATYALPREICGRLGLRRYGFHGIAHEAMWRRWRQVRPLVPEGGRVISVHLGAGCSITAVRAGRAIDTSMGFSPIEGLVMATRCGDVDAGLLLHLQRAEGLSPDRMEDLLNDQSGLLGISGVSGDMRALIGSTDPAARLAVQVFCYRARKYVGAYLAALGGADAVLIGGGVGEHAAAVRAVILADMQWCGIAIDPEANRAADGKEARISGAGGAVEVWVIPVDEAEILAQEAAAVASPREMAVRKEGRS